MVQSENSIHGTTKTTTVNVSTSSKTENGNKSNTIMPQYSYDKGKKAYNAGQSVGANLIGYTTDEEKCEVRNIITNEIDNEYVTNFLRGYEDYKESNRYFGKELIGGVVPDHFFEQLRSENGFEDNNVLITSVATKLMKNFEMCGAEAQAKQIKEILTHNPLTKDDTKLLDKLAQETIKYLN